MSGTTKDLWALLPFDAVREIVRLLTHGVAKHDRPQGDDWRKGRAWSVDFEAAQRHLTAWWMGEGPDPQSGRSHLVHAAARVLILLASELRAIGDDDRPAIVAARAITSSPDGAERHPGAAPADAGADRQRAPLIYLATPYTNYPHGMPQAFRDAAVLAARLLRCGTTVYSPIAHTHPMAYHGGLNPTDHDLWLGFDAVMMDRADALWVAHMPGWERSRGIMHEIAVFEAAGKPIFDLDPQSLIATRRGTGPAA